jgi:hypothetical protein
MRFEDFQFTAILGIISLIIDNSKNNGEIV